MGILFDKISNSCDDLDLVDGTDTENGRAVYHRPYSRPSWCQAMIENLLENNDTVLKVIEESVPVLVGDNEVFVEPEPGSEQTDGKMQLANTEVIIQLNWLT